MSLLDTQQPIMIILLLYSFLSFKYDSKLKIIRADTKYLVISICMTFIIQGFYIYISTRNVAKFSSFADENSEVSVLITIVEQWSLEIGMFFGFYNGIINRRKQIKFLNGLVAMEQKINKLKYSFCTTQKIHEQLKRTLFLILITMLIKFFFISEFNL